MHSWYCIPGQKQPRLAKPTLQKGFYRKDPETVPTPKSSTFCFHFLGCPWDSLCPQQPGPPLSQYTASRTVQDLETDQSQHQVHSTSHKAGLLNCWVHFTIFNIFIYLAAPGLSCSMWDLVPWPGIKPWPPVSGIQVLAPGPPGKSHVRSILKWSLACQIFFAFILVCSSTVRCFSQWNL